MIDFILLVFWQNMAPSPVRVAASSFEEAAAAMCKMPIASRTPHAVEHRDEKGNVVRVQYLPCFDWAKRR